MVFGNSKFAAAAVLLATFAMASTFGASFSPGALNQATAGTNTTQVITVTSGNLSNLTVSAFIGGGTGFTSGNLIVSLVNKTVTITGTPPGAGTVTFSVDATEGAVTSSQPYTLTVNPALNVTPPFLNGATIGVVTNQAITINGGSKPFTSVTVSGFSDSGTGLTAGAFTTNNPPMAASTVTLNGTPTGPGSASFTVNTTDAAGATLAQNYTISVFQFSPTSFSSTQALSPTSQTQTITGGVKPYASIVPTNISAGTTGLSGSNFAVNTTLGTVTFSGTPPTPGTFTFSIVVTDAAGNSFTTNNSIVITPAPISFTPSSLPAGIATTNYSQTVTAIGGTGIKTLSFMVTSGMTPPGITINTASNPMTVSGASPSAGSVTILVSAMDSVGATGSASYTITINLKYSPLILNQATAGTATNQTITVSGQTGALDFTGTTGSFSVGATGLMAGDLTTGASSVTLAGTPTSAGTATFSLMVTDAGSGMSLNIPYTLTVNPALVIAPASLAQATVGTATNQVITVSNGTTPYTALTVTNFMANGTGLTQLSNFTTNLGAGTVTLSGTPSGMGMATFDVNVTDTAGATTMKSYTLAVNPSLVINPSTLPGGDVGVAYDRTVTVTNGTTPYTALTVTGFNDSGTTGLLVGNITPTLATGAVRFMGTPTGTGTITFTVNATDTAGATLTNTYTVVINPALTIAIQPAAQAAPSMVSVALNPTTVGVMPVQTIKVSNGTTPYTTFNVSNFSGGGTGISIANLVVNPSLGTVVVGGTAPTVAGTVSFRVNVVDTAGGTLTQDYTLLVNPILVIAPLTTPATDVGQVYSRVLTITNGTPVYTITVPSFNAGSSSFTQNSNITIGSNTVTVSGTPTLAGTVTFTVNVVDKAGATLSQAYSLTINPALSFSPTPAASILVPPAPTEIQQATALTLYNRIITVNGGTLPFTALTVTNYSAGTTGLTAPSINMGAGTVTFNSTPALAGTVTFDLSVTDSALPVATKTSTYTIVVNPPMSIVPAALNGAATGVPTNQTITVSGGTKPYTPVSVTSVLLGGTTWSTGPSFAINQAGTVTLTGTPSQSGLLSFDVNTTDSAGAMLTKHYTLSVFAFNPPYTATTVGVLTNQVLTITGGVSPYIAVTVSLVNSGGTSLTAANLAIVAGAGTVTLNGTSTTAGTLTFNISVTDANGASFDTANSITVNPKPTVTTATLPDWTINKSGYSQALASTGGTGAITFATTSGTLPTGLALSTGGVLSGTPTAVGSFSFTIAATDSLGATGVAKAFTVIINPIVVVTPPSAINWTINKSGYSLAISNTGGTGVATFAVTSGALPTGLSLATNGALTGTPTLGGTFNFTVTATDSVGATGLQAYTIIINPAVTVSPSTLPDWTINKSGYTQTITSANGTGARTLSLSSGAIPTGMSFNTGSGVLNGTPTAAGTFNFTITSTDSVGATGSQAYVIAINPAVTVSPSSLPNWTINKSGYTQTVTSANGTGARTLSLSSGAIPTGMTFTAGTGILTGTPTAAGTFNFTITSTDSVGATGAQSYTVVINPAVTVSPSTLPDWTINKSGYTQTITTANGTGAKTLSVSAGAIPTGLTFVPGTGVLSGTPTAASTFNFTITSTDSVGATGSQAYTVVINPAVTVSPSTLPDWTINKSGYTQTITTANGTGAKTLSVSAGTIPTGFTFVPGTGVLSGTPTAASTFNFTITSTDSVGATGSQSYTIVINPAVTVSPSTLPDWTINKSGYTQTITTANGTGSKTLSLSAGSIPTGLTFTSGTGVLAGTPTATGTFNFTITSTDSVGATGAQSYTIVINPAVTVSPNTLVDWTINKSGYTQTITTANGTGTKTLSVSTGSIPTGLTFVPGTGVLSGTPTAASTFNFTITSTDSVGATGSQSYTVVINPAVTVSPTTLVDWTINKSGYTQTITTAFGTGSKTLSLSAGSIPTGLTFVPGTGVLSGTPTAAGTFNFTITSTDTVGATGSRSYTVVINPAVTVSPSTLPDWTLNKSGYTQTIASANGTGSKTLAVSAGSVPNGLTFTPGTGVLAGTPTLAGTFIFIVTATDTVGATGSQAYSIVINPIVSIDTPDVTDWTVNQPNYFDQVLASGGTGSKTFSLASGSLPTGLSLNSSTGSITGTPTVIGTYQFTITATDSVGAAASLGYVIDINPAVTLSPSSLPNWTLNKSGYSQTFVGSNGTGIKTLSLTSGSIPTGLTFTPATGALSGTPTAVGTFNFTITATDSVGASLSQGYSITINSVVTFTTTPLALSPNAALNIPYSKTLTATGGTGTLTFTSGILPAGLTLNTSGVLSGTPSAVVTNFAFLVTVTDSVGATALATCTLTVTGVAPIINSVIVNPTSFAYVGQSVSVTIGSVTTDDGKPAIVTIQFGDGTAPISGLSATHLYTVKGVYQITITATNQTSGLVKTIVIPMTIGLSILGNSEIIGKNNGNTVQLGFGGKYTVNYGTRSKSTAYSRIVNLQFANGLTQDNLTGAAGTLTIGTGPNAVLYPFALTSKGNAKTNLLTGIAISIKDSTAQFTTVGDARLATYAESIGVTSNVTKITKLIPVTIEIPGKVYIYVQLEIAFNNPVGKVSAGKLTQ